MPRWTAVAAALFVIALAAALRVNELTHWSLNNDEIAEVRWSSGSFAHLLHEVRRDKVHPPLDYFVQFAIARVNGPEWLHRVPAVFFGVGTVALVSMLGNLWAGPAAGIAAGLFAALAPMHVRYSQEVRPYSMGLFFVCASLVALEYYARTRRRSWAVAWFVCVFLSGATLYFAGLVAGSSSLFRVFCERRDALRGLWKKSPLVIAAWTLLYSPWLVVLYRLSGESSGQPREILNRDWWQLRAQTLATGDWQFEPITLGSWVFWLSVAAGIVLAFRQRPLRTAVFWFLAGTALEVAVLQIHPHFSTPRYLMPSWPPAFVLAGAGIGLLLRTIPGRAAAAMIILLFSGHALLTLDTYYHGDRSDWRGLAEFVHERAQPGETVLLANNWVARNFGFYWQQLPPRDGVNTMQFGISNDAWHGPLWIVTGQCMPRAPLLSLQELAHWPPTEEAHIFVKRDSAPLPMNEELCPE